MIITSGAVALAAIGGWYEMDAWELLAKAEEFGRATIFEGVYLYSRAGIEKKRGELPNDDHSWGVDYTIAPYWLIADEGHTFIPVFNAFDSELLYYLKRAPQPDGDKPVVLH